MIHTALVPIGDSRTMLVRHPRAQPPNAPPARAYAANVAHREGEPYEERGSPNPDAEVLAVFQAALPTVFCRALLARPRCDQLVSHRARSFRVEGQLGPLPEESARPPSGTRVAKGSPRCRNTGQQVSALGAAAFLSLRQQTSLPQALPWKRGSQQRGLSGRWSSLLLEAPHALTGAAGVVQPRPQPCQCLARLLPAPAPPPQLGEGQDGGTKLSFGATAEPECGPS
mmetsp:Transcript_78162/g.203081  ORF Transcript_78162/g.203081 Transcript_78162/m.203081 type:complete len:227 (-) Transcript_78162:178-858(-)